jgi:ketosteroid isomerase-like protein
MLEQNTQLVRRFFEMVNHLLETWQPRGSRADATRTGEIPPAVRELLGCMDPEAEWRPAFSTEVYRGSVQMAKGWDELLEAAGNYTLELREASELDADRVFAVVRPRLVGLKTGIEVDISLYVLITLRDGLITRVDEFTDRGEALQAAGLRG